MYILEMRATRRMESLKRKHLWKIETKSIRMLSLRALNLFFQLKQALASNNHNKTVKNGSNSKLFMKFACLRSTFFLSFSSNLWIHKYAGPPTHKHTNIHFYCNVYSEIVIEMDVRRNKENWARYCSKLWTFSIGHQTPNWHTCDFWALNCETLPVCRLLLPSIHFQIIMGNLIVKMHPFVFVFQS